MNLKKIETKIKSFYSTNSNDIRKEFYSPCFEESVKYFRISGYFTSSIFDFKSMIRSIYKFIENGGRMTIICSPQINEEDEKAILEGYKKRLEVLEESVIDELERLMNDSENINAAKFVATLIANNILDIKIAENKDLKGIMHEKLGLFEDSEGNQIIFQGSNNETLGGAYINQESFSVCKSWLKYPEDNFNLTLNHLKTYQNKTINSVNIYDFSEASRKKIIHHSVGNREDLKKLSEEIIKEESVNNNEDSNTKSLFGYQEDAIRNWENNDYTGIFEHVTGAGKTFEAIKASEFWLNNNKPVLVIVPSLPLAYQWEDEFINLSSLESKDILNCAKQKKWKERIKSWTSKSDEPKLVIAIINTASDEDFINRINDGDNLMIIVDEVHNAGAPQFSKIFSIKAGAKLGLTATLERDDEGLNKIKNYFKGSLDKDVVHKFTLEDAINHNPQRLCNYQYDFSTARLNSEEQEKYDELTKKLNKNIAMNEGDNSGQSTKRLMIERARIRKKCEQKSSLAIEIISKNYKEKQRWLVYCEDNEQLDEIRSNLYNNHNKKSWKYESNLNSKMKKEILEDFEEFGGIVFSMGCLDEGVDIPNADHALIISSSTSKRQYIQRRGRVLRMYKTAAYKKRLAKIFDIVTLPNAIHDDKSKDSFYTEFERVSEFALSCLNTEIKIKINKELSKLKNE